MNRVLHSPAVVALLAACAALLTIAGCHHADVHSALRFNFTAPEGSPVLLAAYQPWFGRGNHINVGYSSQDVTVLQRQIADARALGIRGFVVNWYGPRKEYEDRAYALLQQTAAQ